MYFKAEKYWMAACCLLLLAIIFIGGLTRLTGSGLSIVEWKPITGIIPPLNTQGWEIEFAKYKTYPEFKVYNSAMSIAEFKVIYYYEYIHRVLGRLIGIVFIIPFVYLYTKGLDRKSTIYYFIILLLILLQGFVGWYMVKSGLSQIARVSHYRLALHFMLAVAIYSMCFLRLIKI